MKIAVSDREGQPVKYRANNGNKNRKMVREENTPPVRYPSRNQTHVMKITNIASYIIR